MGMGSGRQGKEGRDIHLSSSLGCNLRRRHLVLAHMG
jgi:hypothetical protein